MNLKKAISPVVGTSLLIVVAVVALIGFQQWYSGYQSILTNDVETKSTSSGSINIEYLSSDGIIFVTNSGTSNVSMSSIKIGDKDCLIGDTLKPGVNNISVKSCLDNTGTNEIIIITDSGIIEESLFVNNIPAKPSVSFSSDTNNVYFGENFNLTWSAQNAASCEAFGNWSGSKSLSGSEIISNVQENSTYYLNCSGNIESVYVAIDYRSCLNLTQNMVSVWHMDNDWTDGSVNSFDGTVYGATFDTTNNKVGVASGNFDGVNDYVNLPTDPLFYPNSGSYTYSGWWKFDPACSPQACRQGSIIKNRVAHGGLANKGWHLLANVVPINGNYLEFTHGDGTNLLYTGQSIPVPYDWHHFSIVRDKSVSRVYMYVDGVIKKNLSDPTGNINAFTESFNIGSDTAGNFADDYYRGLIDEISIHKRALSSLDVDKMYAYGNQGIPLCDS